MRKLSRLFKHLYHTSASGRKSFPPATLKAIEAEITAGEKMHRAEVRLIVEPALHIGALWHGTTSRRRALDLFAKYRIWDTEENCGILIYVSLADRKVEIVADRGVSRLIGHADWKAVCQTMTKGFAQGGFHHSALAALAQLNALLQMHLPANGVHLNHLPDSPLIL